MNYAIIMAGGAGTRFWPLSTEEKPKQFLDILGTGKTFIQMTVERFKGIIPTENIYIVTNEKYRALIHEQLPDLNDHQIIAEPSRNNTAPCILLAALKVQKKDPEACCVFVPADHLIINTASYQQNILAALHHASTHHAIVTIGIVPTRPETGYGYIKFDPLQEEGIKRVEQFVEKPNIDTARLYVASGNYLWNAGMFAWHVNTIVQQYQSLSPEVFNILSTGSDAYNTAQEKQFLADHYAQTPNISVDFAIMEKSDCVYTLSADFDWSDLGIWSSVYEASAMDAQGNVQIGGKELIESSGDNLIILPHGKKAIIRGLKEMIIVDSGEALLIYPRKAEADLKSSIQKMTNT
ncbi:MAG: mannose-1-phosphate guanylyltransferase [Saprospiraceae bacterium]|nr:mannose-1-phosphate guanylyltransferase [Saprospiraceae bacterium]